MINILQFTCVLWHMDSVTPNKYTQCKALLKSHNSQVRILHITLSLSQSILASVVWFEVICLTCMFESLIPQMETLFGEVQESFGYCVSMGHTRPLQE